MSGAKQDRSVVPLGIIRLTVLINIVSIAQALVVIPRIAVALAFERGVRVTR